MVADDLSRCPTGRDSNLLDGEKFIRLAVHVVEDHQSIIKGASHDDKDYQRLVKYVLEDFPKGHASFVVSQ